MVPLRIYLCYKEKGTTFGLYVNIDDFYGNYYCCCSFCPLNAQPELQWNAFQVRSKKPT